MSQPSDRPAFPAALTSLSETRGLKLCPRGSCDGFVALCVENAGGMAFPCRIYDDSIHSSNFLAGTWSDGCLDEDKKPLKAAISLKNLVLEHQIQ